MVVSTSAGAGVVTLTGNAGAADGANPGEPVNFATTLCVPVEVKVYGAMATPSVPTVALTVSVPSTMKSTVPPVPCGSTLAVRLTSCPTFAVDGDTVAVVVTASGGASVVTVTILADADVDARNPGAPL